MQRTSHHEKRKAERNHAINRNSDTYFFRSSRPCFVSIIDSIRKPNWFQSDTEYSIAYMSQSIPTYKCVNNTFLFPKQMHEIFLSFMNCFIFWMTWLDLCQNRCWFSSCQTTWALSSKRHEGDSYDLHAAQSYSLMIDRVHSQIQDGAPVDQIGKISATLSNAERNDKPNHESTAGALNAILLVRRTPNDNMQPTFHVKWSTQTNVSSLMTVDIRLMHYLHDQFGPEVTFCTQYKQHIYTFRCHPSFNSGGLDNF